MNNLAKYALALNQGIKVKQHKLIDIEFNRKVQEYRSQLFKN